MIWTLIVSIIFGAIVGGLARLALPGKQNISIPITIGLGIIGSLIGSWLFHVLGGSDDTKGVDWIALILGVIVAAILIVIYERVVSSRGTGTRSRI